MKGINPYINFEGNCEEAFEFYRSVFGGEFSMIHRFADMDSGMPIADDEKNNIMHVSLPIGNTILMGSDCPSGMFQMNVGNNISIAIDTDSEAEATRIHDGISAGGTVTMPMEKTFWGAFFGMATDKFGINWMVNYDYPQKP